MLFERSEIRKAVLQKLKEPLAIHDFKLRGHSFERISEHGLSQQISRGLDWYGGSRDQHLALGFLITIREWVLTYHHPYIAERNWRTAGAAEILDNSTDLVPHNDGNVWYPLNLGVEALSGILNTRIQTVLIPHLDKLRTRSDIISMWRIHGQAIGLPPRHKLSIGILMFLNEWKEEGRAMLEQVRKENPDNEYYQKAIKRLLGNPREIFAWASPTTPST